MFRGWSGTVLGLSLLTHRLLGSTYGILRIRCLVMSSQDAAVVTHDFTLTTPFLTTLRDRAANDADFRIALLEYAVESVLAGDLDETKAVLRTYIKATTGYEDFAKQIGVHPKSLIRMLGPDGNPRSSNLLALLAQTLQLEDVRVEVRTTPKTAA